MLLNPIFSFFKSLSTKTRRCLLMSALVPLTPLMLHNTMDQLDQRQTSEQDSLQPLKVSLGTAVYLESEQEDSKSWLTLVATPDANLNQGELSVLSPLGQALLGKDAGDEVRVKVLGSEMRFVISQITKTNSTTAINTAITA
ncbi:GreA/GreB family elongation factor [Rheinheimera sp. WS51]|uniref:GreA/GreB family elongation factor n=1 Tax=Rheinheimera sp. WS51 TaxID=3425886 RepID=UPI003D8F42D3